MSTLGSTASLTLSVLCCVGAASAQNWLNRIVPGPAPRSGHAMAYDSARGVTVLFGGTAGPGTSAFTDTWEWDGTVWTLRQPAVAPTASGRMVFDSARGVCVLVNGSTWEWDGSNWSQVSAQFVWTTHLAFDSARSRTVALTQLATPGSTPAVVMEWDGVSWQSISTSVGPFGSVMSMTYDATNQRTVAFTPFLGFSNPTAGPRLWQWDGVAWVGPGGGSGTYYSGGVMVDTQNGLRFYGGTTSGTTMRGFYFPNATTGEVTPADPGGRSGHAMVFDSARQRVVLFGGTYESYPLGVSQQNGETWEYVAGPVTATSAVYGGGCGTPALTLATTAGSRPVLGATFSSDIGNDTVGATGMLWGTSGSRYFVHGKLPIDMGPWGMAGCQLWNSADGLASCVTVGNATQFHLPIPASVSLIAVQLHLQAISFRAGQNQLQMVSSNGLQLTVGDL